MIDFEIISRLENITNGFFLTKVSKSCPNKRGIITIKNADKKPRIRSGRRNIRLVNMIKPNVPTIVSRFTEMSWMEEPLITNLFKVPSIKFVNFSPYNLRAIVISINM